MVTSMSAWPVPLRPLISTARLPKSPMVPLGVARRLLATTFLPGPPSSQETSEMIFTYLGASSLEAQFDEPADPGRYSPLEMIV